MRTILFSVVLVIALLSGNDIKAQKRLDLIDHFENTDLVYNILEDADTLWICSKHGIIKHLKDGTLLEEYKKGVFLPDEVTDATIDPLGNKWFAMRDSGLVKYNGTEWEFIHDKNEQFLNIQAIESDSKGNIWYGANSGVVKFDGSSYTFYADYNSNYAGIGDVNDILINNDTIWVGGGSGPLNYYDGTEWKNIQESGITQYSVIKALDMSPDGNLWILHSDKPLMYDGKQVYNYDTLDWGSNEATDILAVSSNEVYVSNKYAINLMQNRDTSYTVADYWDYNYAEFTTISKFGANFWYGTNQGLIKDIGYSYLQYTYSNELIHPRSMCIGALENGTMLVGSWGGGLSISNDENWSYYNSDSTGFEDRFRDIERGPDSTLWLTSDKDKIFEYKNGDFTIHDFENDTHYYSLYHGLHVNDNGVVYASTGNGLMIYNNTGWSYLPSGGSEYGLINSVTSDTNHKIWMGIQGNEGVYTYDEGVYQHYTTSDGLCSDEVHSIAADKNGNVWIGHSNCITQYNGSSFITHQGESFNFLQRIDDIEIDAEGNPWAACTDGILYYDGTEWTKYRNLTAYNGVDDLFIGRKGKLYSIDKGGAYLWDVTLNSAPTDIILSGDSLITSENLGEQEWTLTAVDSNVGDIHTFELVQGDGTNDKHNDYFHLSENTLILSMSVNASDDLDIRFLVEATDSYGGAIQKSFILTNTFSEFYNHPPTDIRLTNNTISTGVVGESIGTFSAEDLNANDEHSFSIVVSEDLNDSNNDHFIIQNNNELILNQTVAESDQQEFNIVVEVTDLAGNTYTKQFEIYNEINSTGMDNNVPTNFAVYPNPSSGIFIVHVPDGKMGTAILYDYTGRLLLKREFSSELTFGSELSKGVYSLLIIVPGGWHQYQIIKE